jgi:hypothetical protein
MRVTAALLADAAQVVGGKLFMLGGAIDTLTTRDFPATRRTLSLVLVLEVGPGDRNRDLEVVTTLYDEDGKEMGVHSKGTFRVGAPSTLPAGATSLVPLVMVFGNLQFPEPGGYVFIMEHDGQELARVPLRVQRPPGMRGL